MQGFFEKLKDLRGSFSEYTHRSHGFSFLIVNYYALSTILQKKIYLKPRACAIMDVSVLEELNKFRTLKAKIFLSL